MARINYARSDKRYDTSSIESLIDKLTNLRNEIDKYNASERLGFKKSTTDIMDAERRFLDAYNAIYNR